MDVVSKRTLCPLHVIWPYRLHVTTMLAEPWGCKVLSNTPSFSKPNLSYLPQHVRSLTCAPSKCISLNQRKTAIYYSRTLACISVRSPRKLDTVEACLYALAKCLPCLITRIQNSAFCQKNGIQCVRTHNRFWCYVYLMVP